MSSNNLFLVSGIIFLAVVANWSGYGQGYKDAKLEERLPETVTVSSDLPETVGFAEFAVKKSADKVKAIEETPRMSRDDAIFVLVQHGYKLSGTPGTVSYGNSIKLDGTALDRLARTHEALKAQQELIEAYEVLHETFREACECPKQKEKNAHEKK